MQTGFTVFEIGFAVHELEVGDAAQARNEGSGQWFDCEIARLV